MSDNPLLRINKIISKKPVYLFWALQICFWSFVSLISLVSLTLWYVQIDVEHLSHTFWQSVIGIALSMPLYWIFMKCWNAPIFTRVLFSIASVLLISFLWTVIRVELYISLVMVTGMSLAAGFLVVSLFTFVGQVFFMASAIISYCNLNIKLCLKKKLKQNQNNYKG